VNINEVKLLLREDILVEEMSRIFSKDGFVVYVYNESYSNPSFHVLYKHDFEVVLQIKDLYILEVKFGNFKKGTQLPNLYRKSLKNILLEEQDGISKWKFLLMTWNANNDYKYHVDINIPYPE